jgi:hypothetical protein
MRFWDFGDVYEAGIEAHMEIASEDATRMLAEWVVDQGVEYNDRVLDDLAAGDVPRRAPDHLPDFKGTAQSIYEKRFGRIPLRDLGEWKKPPS